MKKLLFTFTLLCGIGAVSFYTLGSFAQDKEKPSTSVSATPPKPMLEVATLQLRTQQITRQRSLPGRVTAFRQSVVRPQVDGLITKRMFEEGAEVKKGQQLYQIDDTRYRAVLSSAVADLKSAQANLKAVKARTARYKELIKVNAISRQEYDDVVAGLDQAQAAIGVAQANVDLAKVDVNYTKVYAPISGRISRSVVTEGALVTANQTQELATITALDPVYIDMQQSAGDQTVMELHAELSRNSSIAVHLMLESKNGANVYAHTGKLKFSEVTMDPSTGATTLRAVMPNPDGHLLPGMFVRAVLDLGQEEVLLVPQRATTRTAQGNVKVWIVDSEGKVQQRSIKVDSAYEDNWIVVNGLEAGDELIVEGYQKVREGQPVKTVNWQSTANTNVASVETI